MAGSYWGGEMRPGEVALFHFEGKSRVMCGADGDRSRTAATKFATIEDAEAYAKRYVEAHPARGCRMYDSTGQRIRDIMGEKCPRQRYTRAQAKRDLIIGLAGFVLVPLGFFIDKWIGWGLFLGMAVGTKFVLLGIIKLSEGIAGLMESKQR
jgi:hypothetical protein